MASNPDPTEFRRAVNPDQSPLNADGFVGVDPVYQNFANETDRPLESDVDIDPEDEDEDELDTKVPAAKTTTPPVTKPATKP